METTLHRQLKQLYAGDAQQVEVRLGRYRIDAIVAGELVEIQHGSLAAIRDKIATLCDEHAVRVVKPLVVSKRLIKRAKKNGKIIDRRQSPLRGGILQVFDELVYFTRVFPHANLTLEVPLVEVEEWRYPGHGRRRRWRERDHVVEDQKLVAIRETHTFRTAHELTALLPASLPKTFDTAEIATALGVQRWIAQRIAYCLRKMNGIASAGKRGNAHLYQRCAPNHAKRKSA
jgi:hypothetical protein